MEWDDEGLVLARRKHGETAAIVTLFARRHGRHLGLVRGGGGRRGGALYQPGNLVAVRWRARLAEHLGSVTGELVANFSVRVLDDPLRLAALSSLCALIDAALPEREPHPKLFDATLDLLRRLGSDEWATRYVRWEVECLAELGFGLDLSGSESAGPARRPPFVSSRSGRIVAAAAEHAPAGRLLRLPRFLGHGEGRLQPARPSDILDGLLLTGEFFERHVFVPHGRRLPAARLRLVDRWRRSATISGGAESPER